ncbi:hypothetical protein DL93DRAFT_1683088 [Clavulina sp. PMI_390]|nr:hypothetical protein DL93DRAFT_1683088 [Clavulina sp. PMI_390]
MKLVLRWASDEILRLQLQSNYLPGLTTWEEFVEKRQNELPYRRKSYAYYQLYRKLAGPWSSISHDEDMDYASINDGVSDDEDDSTGRNGDMEQREGHIRGRGLAFSEPEVDLMASWIRGEALRTGSEIDQKRGPKFWESFFDKLPQFRSAMSYYAFYRRESEKVMQISRRGLKPIVPKTPAEGALPPTVASTPPSAPISRAEGEFIRNWAALQCERLGVEQLVGLEPWKRFIESNREDLPAGCSAISYYNFYHNSYPVTAPTHPQDSIQVSNSILPAELPAEPSAAAMAQPSVLLPPDAENGVKNTNILSEPAPDPHSPISHQSTLKRTRSPSLAQAPSSPPIGKRSRLSKVTVTSESSNTVKLAHWREFAFRKLDQHIMKMEYSTSDYMLLVKYVMRERPDPDDPMEVLNMLSIIAESEEGSHHDKKWWMRLYYADADFFELLDHRLRTT